MMILGIIILIAGAVMYFGGRLGLGRLPGDIVYRKGNFTFYFPLATSILLSIILTLIFTLMRLRK
ncbi:MAG: DUF2905 domain-containing protein [Acetivibrionales bacterium]